MVNVPEVIVLNGGGDDDDDEGLPPHAIVARASMAASPAVNADRVMNP
jgi:hypothetical protein